MRRGRGKAVHRGWRAAPQRLLRRTALSRATIKYWNAIQPRLRPKDRTVLSAYYAVSLPMRLEGGMEVTVVTIGLFERWRDPSN